MKRSITLLLVAVLALAILPHNAGAAGGQPTALTYTGAAAALWDDTVPLRATLSSKNAPVQGQDITFTVGTLTFTAATNANGVASVSARITLDAANYLLEARYAGGRGLAPSSATGTFTVTQRPVTLSGQCTCNGMVGQPMPVGVQLKDDRNAAVAGRAISVTLSRGTTTAATLTLTTGTNGGAATNVVPSAGAGTYRLDWHFNGDNHYAPAQDTKIFDLTARPTFMWYFGDHQAQVGKDTTLIADLYDQIAITRIGSAPVTFTLIDALGNEVRSVTAITDSTGRATTAMRIDEQAGSYTLRVSFAGDDTYQSTWIEVEFSVVREMTFIWFEGPLYGTRLESSTVTARLTSEQGHLFAGAPVTFRLLSPSGELLTTASSITDGSGLATATFGLDYCACVCRIEASYAGDAAHDPSSVSSFFSIGARPTRFTFTVPRTVAWGDDMPISGLLVDALTGEPLAGKTVSFFMADSWQWPGPVPTPNVTATTDENGVVNTTLRVTEEPNWRRTVSGWFEGDGGFYGPDFPVHEVEVTTRRAELQIVEAPFRTWRGDDVRFVAELKDTARGTPITGVALTFAITPESSFDQEWSASATTGTDGRAEVLTTISVPRGFHHLLVSFDDPHYFVWPADWGLFVDWQYWFQDQLGRDVHLNPATKEFRFDAPDDSPPDQTDPNMTVIEGPNDFVTVVVDYTSDDITMKGFFQTLTGLHSAVITTAKGTYAFI